MATSIVGASILAPILLALLATPRQVAGAPRTGVSAFTMADHKLGAYTYDYASHVTIHPDEISTASNGFQFNAKVQFQDVFLLNNDRLIRIYLDGPKFSTSGHTGDVRPSYTGGEWLDSYAHVVTMANGTAYVKQCYFKQNDHITYKNIKKSLMLNLIPTDLHSSSQQQQSNYLDNNFLQQPELFSPDSFSQLMFSAKLSTGRTNIFQEVEAHQNVTFRSRVYGQANSTLTTTLALTLIDSDDSSLSSQSDMFSRAQTIDKAIALLLPHGYVPENVALQRVPKICSHHHCAKTLNELFQDYRDSLTDKSLATVNAAVAYLKLMAKLRESDGTSLADITKILKKLKSGSSSRGSLNSFLDILASARTKDSILAAMKYLNLRKSDKLDMAERFLSVLSVAAKTAAKMRLDRPIQSPYHFATVPALGKSSLINNAPIASIEFIANELLSLIQGKPDEEWALQKLRWSTLLTLSSLVHAHNQEHNFENLNDKINKKVGELLRYELNKCDKHDTDCRIVVIQAIGNIGNLDEENFEELKDQVLYSGRRESIAAMKALRDCLQNCASGQHLSLSFYGNIRDLLIRVVYDQHQETTARILASELIVRFIPDSLASEQLLSHIPSFGNNELATMIYSRVMSLRPESKTAHNDNWYWKSCIINGTSASFIKTMARTPSLNASYGVNVELLNRGKLLKESSFDVMLDTNQRTQDLFSVGIFARGLQGIPGVSVDDSNEIEDENESTMAGMTLRLLGGYLRPYVFFTGTGELMSHIWSGTASDPTTAFSGDLLLIDHEEGYPLISGFVAEQQMRGVLSIEVTGKIKISLWYRSSHSVVRTKGSVIVQSSQGVYTGHENMWTSHLFSFGGQAMVDFVADSNFLSSPFKICLQVTQPEFKFRHNSRRHEQLLSDQIQRRYARQERKISAKSYPLNKGNNLMCSNMNDEL